MWDKMIESLSGVAQPTPAQGVKVARPIAERAAKQLAFEERNRRRAAAEEKEERVLAALRIRGKVSSCDFDSLGLDQINVGMIEAALQRLRHKGKVRLVMARPYWEAVE